MIDGFYSIAFSGQSGSGFGLLVLQRGVIVGADAAGAIFDGTYKTTEGAPTFDVDVIMQAPAGVSPVQTGIPLAHAMELPIKTRLPLDFGSGKTSTIETPIGPVNIVFKKIRDLPN